MLSAEKHLAERFAAVRKWRAQDYDREITKIGRVQRPKPRAEEHPRRERIEAVITRWRGVHK